MRWRTAVILAIAVLGGASFLCNAQAVAPGLPAALSPQTSPELKIFEAATGLANTLTSWAFLMIGGSILAILGTSYYRPLSLWVRCSYLAFVPAWFLLSWSVYAGTRVQSVYLAALYSRAPKIELLKESLNHDSLAQIGRMEAGLACYGLWLTVYLIWWIFNKEKRDVKQ